MSIADIVQKAQGVSFEHLGTDVKVFDDLGNEIDIVRAIISKQPASEPYTGLVVNQYQIKFYITALPSHQSGLIIHSWRGNFTLFTVIDKTPTTVTYSLQAE